LKQTDEIRWFYPQPMPPEVKSWFCSSRLCQEETLRTDQYLVLAGSNEVGVKVRGGEKFEIKARTLAPEPLMLLTGASVGFRDSWVKWTLEDCDAALKMAAVGTGSSEWVPVSKQRWLRKFQIATSGQVEETDADAVIEHGCRAELSEVDVRDSRWWTLALESFGDTDRRADLERFARHFLRILPRGLVLGELTSMAYPEWLNRLREKPRVT
jgi:hypothetical protein